ncbi:MAG: hypothetical protein AAFR58_07645 [Cyanobacteria bacterium J06627_28]
MTITPRQLLDYFVYIAPDFQNFWDSDENLSIADDGTYNFHAVCSVFSHYFRDQSAFRDTTLLYEKEWTRNIDKDKLEKLFLFVEENMIEAGESENDLDNALATCFLENITHTKAADNARKFMGKKTRKYFDYWNV